MLNNTPSEILWLPALIGDLLEDASLRHSHGYMHGLDIMMWWEGGLRTDL